MASMPRRRTIYTFDGLIDALGGNKAAAELLGVAPPVVSQWRKAGRIPARRMEVIFAELARKDATAVRSLFDFDPPKEYRDDEPKRAKRA
jgi:DNA-binding transcriptional regulator YdaS (Cro superfamily)